MSWLEKTRDWCKELEQILAKDTRTFSKIAFDEMSKRNFLDGYDGEKCIRDFMAIKPTPKQVDPRSQFGAPAFTLFFSERFNFVLDMYNWHGSVHTSIHNHFFEGSFTVLEGSSVETIYDFECENLEFELVRGDLIKNKCFYIQPGEVREIPRGNQLIHRVVHLENPTVSLVLRTVASKGDNSYIQQKQFKFGEIASPVSLDEQYYINLNSVKWFVARGKIPPPSIFQKVKDYVKTWEYLISSKIDDLTLQKLCMSVSPTFYQNIVDIVATQIILQNTDSPDFKKLFCFIDFFTKDGQADLFKISNKMNIDQTQVRKMLHSFVQDLKLSDESLAMVKRSKFKFLY